MLSRFTAAVVVVGTAFFLPGCSYVQSLSEDEKIEMRENTSEYQRAVLDDLAVTETEYRDAIDAQRECIQAAGWGVDVLEQKGNQLGFQTSYSGPTAPDDDKRKACANEYISEVGAIWASQREPLTQQPA